MAQHDYNLANQNGAAFRADLNAALEAIQSVNSGTTEPASTVAYMPWADTNSGLWKVRNASDSAWVSVLSLTASRVDTAAGTAYDNSGSGLAATNVKDALDELDASVSNVGTASGVSYDNASSGLAATNVKDAIDEIVVSSSPSQDQTTWNTGTDTTESRISPEKLDAKIKTLAIGEGQAWQNVSSQRSFGSSFTNTTGRTICVSIHTNVTVSSSWFITLSVRGTLVARMDRTLDARSNDGSLFAVVPPGDTYYSTASGVSLGTDVEWVELR